MEMSTNMGMPKIFLVCHFVLLDPFQLPALSNLHLQKLHVGFDRGFTEALIQLTLVKPKIMGIKRAQELTSKHTATPVFERD